MNKNVAVTAVTPGIPPSKVFAWVKDEIEALDWTSESVEQARPRLGPRLKSAIQLLVLGCLTGNYCRLENENASVCPKIRESCHGENPTGSELQNVWHCQ